MWPDCSSGFVRMKNQSIKSSRYPQRYLRTAALLILSILLLLAVSADAEEIRYRVRFRGVDERALLNDLRSVSNTEILRNRPPASIRQLQRRAERDVERFTAVLQSYGYYDPSIRVSIQEDRSPVRVRFHVDPGERYTFRHIHFELIDYDDDAAYREGFAAWIAEDIGQPAIAREVQRKEERLIRWLGNQGYPFARMADRRVEVHHSARAMDIWFKVERGPIARFGEVELIGLERVQPIFVQNKQPWSQGDRFEGAKMRMYQRRLMDANLFSSARFVKGSTLTDEGELPLEVIMSERHHRSLSAGVGFRSDEGGRANVGVEHRNLRGHGERASLVWDVSEIGYGVNSRFLKPDFRTINQNLNVSVRAALEEPDAFRSRFVSSLISIDRPYRRNAIVSSGIGFRYTAVREDDREERFGLLYLPLGIEWDGSDDVLDPRRGSRRSLSTAPYRDMINSEIAFIKSRASIAYYHPLIRRPTIDFAWRGVFGQIAGVSRDALPADERLYAGGGGSVRGYAFQSIGPLDEKRPLGGKSQWITSVELRWRINSEFGLVAFGDGGAVYEEGWPDGMSDAQWGAGAGFRYFTPVGPLRLDLAFPVNRRSGIDDSYQFYISLGQAF